MKPTNAAVRSALRRLEQVVEAGHPERLAERVPVPDVLDTFVTVTAVLKWLDEYRATLGRRGGLR